LIGLIGRALPERQSEMARRALTVEDESLIAIDLEATLLHVRL